VSPGETPGPTREPGVTPTADATGIATNPPGNGSGDPDDSDTGSGSDGSTSHPGAPATQLPSTGQGTAAPAPPWLVILSLTVVGVICLGAAWTRRALGSLAANATTPRPTGQGVVDFRYGLVALGPAIPQCDPASGRDQQQAAEEHD
jgi:hypothetical protein